MRETIYLYEIKKESYKYTTYACTLYTKAITKYTTLLFYKDRNKLITGLKNF